MHEFVACYDSDNEPSESNLSLVNALTAKYEKEEKTSLSVALSHAENRESKVVTLSGKVKKKENINDYHHNMLVKAALNPAIFSEQFNSMKEVDLSSAREKNIASLSSFPPPPPTENRSLRPALPELFDEKTSISNGESSEALSAESISTFDEAGPWAKELPGKEPPCTTETSDILPPRQQEYMEELEAKRQKAIESFEKLGEGLGTEYIVEEERTTRCATKFFGKSMVNYLGKSWIEPPSQHSRLLTEENISLHGDMTIGKPKCYLPKKKLNSFSGHKRGIQNLRFYPITGHLLLSSGLDGYCKIWDCNSYNLKREILAHKSAVRYLDFTPTGETFLSTGFDGTLFVWDLETGKSKHAFRCKDEAIYFQAKFYPDSPNSVIAACGNHKLIQFDLREKEAVTEYTHHMGPVNTVCFFDNNRKIASTGDDKQMLIWEFGLPVPAQQLTGVHTLSTMLLHPEGNFLTGQCLDNSLAIYAADPNRVHRQRGISGHKNFGKSVELDFSPDGQFVITGDTDGHLFGYHWKTGNVYCHIHAHKSGSCVALAWNPLSQSNVATGGWDGAIHYWD